MATNSSKGTCSAFASACSTVSVGLAVPDSRFVQVARGRPLRSASCCWVKPRVWRSCLMFWARRPAKSSDISLVSCQAIGNGDSALAKSAYLSKQGDQHERFEGRGHEVPNGTDHRRKPRPGGSADGATGQ